MTVWSMAWWTPYATILVGYLAPKLLRAVRG